MEIFELIMDVGAPVAGALVMGYFIFLILKQILGGLVDSIKTLTIGIIPAAFEYSGIPTIMAKGTEYQF